MLFGYGRPMDEPVTAPRLMLLDVLRGAAIVAMILYHLLWDATLLGFVGTDIILSPAAIAAQLTILGSFMFLVGMSLVLATRNGIAWPRFWRRLALVAGAALLITLATLWFFPETYVFFGVLHAAALFSLLALPFLRAPTWIAAATGAIVIVLPLLFKAEIFSERLLAWIGFYPVSPPTNDLVPIFPWLGVVLLGIALMRVFLTTPSAARIAAWRPAGFLSRGLNFAGRWSLVIYLVHQPLLLSILYPLAALRPSPPESRAETFSRSCEASCAATGSAGYCQDYCACALVEIAGRDLWAAAEAAEPTPEQRQSVAGAGSKQFEGVSSR